MTPIEPVGGREASEYWAAAYNLLPVAIIGGLVAMATNLRKIYAMQGYKRRLAELGLTGLVGGLAAAMAVAILPLVFDGPSTNMEIAIAALAGSYGQKTFDMLTDKVLGKRGRRHDDHQD